MKLARPFAGALVALALAGAPAAAADNPSGAHVSQCAQAHLGQRPDAPALTCTCMPDGQAHTFANFGEMAAHMRAMMG
jgi:hypothetical protein